MERMLDLNKKKAAGKTPNILDPFETQISATDRQIDRLTYQLYNIAEAGSLSRKVARGERADSLQQVI
jgi:hypothetical protein